MKKTYFYFFVFIVVVAMFATSCRDRVNLKANDEGYAIVSSISGGMSVQEFLDMQNIQDNQEMRHLLKQRAKQLMAQGKYEEAKKILEYLNEIEKRLGATSIGVLAKSIDKQPIDKKGLLIMIKRSEVVQANIYKAKDKKNPVFSYVFEKNGKVDVVLPEYNKYITKWTFSDRIEWGNPFNVKRNKIVHYDGTPYGWYQGYQ